MSKIPVTYTEEEWSHLNYKGWDPANFEYRRAANKWKEREEKRAQLQAEFEESKSRWARSDTKETSQP